MGTKDLRMRTHPSCTTNQPIHPLYLRRPRDHGEVHAPIQQLLRRSHYRPRPVDHPRIPWQLQAPVARALGAGRGEEGVLAVAEKVEFLSDLGGVDAKGAKDEVEVAVAFLDLGFGVCV